MVKKFIDIDGVCMSMGDAAKHLGVSTSCISYHLKTGKYKEIFTEDRLLDERIKLYRKTHNITINRNLKVSLSNMVKYLKESEIENNFITYVSMGAKGRAIRTLANFHLVYGVVEGDRRYSDYIEKNRISGASHSVEYYKEKSIWNKDYWLSRGLSEAEAKTCIRDLQVANSRKASLNKTTKSHTTHIDYWLYKGYNELEAKQKLRERQTTRKLGPAEYAELHKYYNEVLYYTKSNAYLIENIELRSAEFHLDHIFSIRNGFDNKIPAEIIGSSVNLRIISQQQNNKKYCKSDISVDELYERYTKLQNNGNPNL